MAARQTSAADEGAHRSSTPQPVLSLPPRSAIESLFAAEAGATSAAGAGGPSPPSPFALPPELSPAGFLGSPGIFCPTGSFEISHQQALAQVTAQAVHSPYNMANQTDYSLPFSSTTTPALTSQNVNSSANLASTSTKVMLTQPSHTGNSNIQSDEISQPQTSALTAVKHADDGYNWRKYGQKVVKGGQYTRSYYKCTHSSCPVKKKVERSADGQITQIIYRGQHSHHRPPNRISKDGGELLNEGDDFRENEDAPTRPEPGSHDHSGKVRASNDGPAGLSMSRRGEGGDHLSSSSDIESEGDDESRAGNGDAGPANTKRRHVPTRAQRIIIQTISEVDLLDDGYRWRKFGQKVVKGNPHPRSYYKCTYQGCDVKKHIERSSQDLKVVITTYEGKHNHDVPAARNNSRASAIVNASSSSSVALRGQNSPYHNTLLSNKFRHIGPWKKLKRCLDVVKFVARIKAGIRGYQVGKHYSTHENASIDEHRIAEGTGLRGFCEPATWKKLKKCLNVVMFIVTIQAGSSSPWVRKQDWTRGGASIDELRKQAEGWPAKATGLRGFYQPETWREDLDSDLFEVKKVVKRQRLASTQFCDITPWKRLKKFLNVVKFLIRLQLGVRGHQVRKFDSTTDGSAKIDERGTAKGRGLRVYSEPETWSKDVDGDGSEVTMVVRRQRLDKNMRSSTFTKEDSFFPRHKYLHTQAKTEGPHSTFYDDVHAWIAIKKQHEGDLHHTCEKQVVPELIGRNSIKEKIMEKILWNRSGSNCTVIRIDAASGHGKTSLLRVLYNDQQVMDAFDKRIWIQMSDKSDILMLFRMIVEFTMSDHCSITNLRYLQEMVKEEMSDKKIVLFLDDADIKDQQFWSSVLEVLNAGARGSVVVMSTRIYNVAALTGVATHSYRLRPLSEENNLMLLQQYGALGTVTRSNPDLVMIAKRLISRFGANPLNLKAIGGLLCHADTISLQNDLFDGSVMPLQLCHNVLPIHLKRCLAFCSLFPEGYTFDRHRIILFWMSHGCVRPVEGCELEDVGAEYFNDLLCRSFFQHSCFHNDKDGKFVMHELIYKVVELEPLIRYIYFKSEDLMSSIPENVRHLSLVSSQFQTVELMSTTEKLKDLKTFLVVQPERQQYKVSFPTLKVLGLDDFFLKFTSLETLDLSHTDIEELPGSIASMSNLQYLSINNTSIRALPSELCILSNLQTLNAKGCRFLTELPGDTRNLLKLRHLDVTKEQGRIHLPHGIGQLTELRTLPVFHASGDSSYCCITELGNLHSLRGCLQLSGLDSVKTGSKAQEVNLKDKQHLRDVTLQWYDDGRDIDEDDEEAENVAEQVLECLQPHANLKELAIRGYEGSGFPAWMQGSSSMPNLVLLTLDSCCNCTQFPAIAQLPALKFLSVRKMYDVQRLSSSENGAIKFPSLEVLNLWEMYGLEELFEASEGDSPRLRKICISRCPDLKRLPSIPSLSELVLHSCHQLPDIPELGSLASLKIEGFHGVKSFSLIPTALPVLKKLEIKSCKELSSVHGLEVLSTVQRLKITGCPKLVLSRTNNLAS